MVAPVMVCKPLPLKQRTSSVDPRRDCTTQTWVSVLSLLKMREYVITVDHFSIWRRHLAWAVENGKDLRDYMTQRYAASMVFMSLLLSTELNVLFNSAGVTTAMRQALQHEEYRSVSFWAGMAIIISAILTLLSLISTFTAWTMVSAVSEANAHCIFRSSIGQYVAELPGRFIVGAIYSFLVWICLFFFLLLPVGFWSTLLLVLVVGLFVHTITAFSAFGRVIMHTGAMGAARIFDKPYESQLLPHTLHANLLVKARANLKNKTSIMRQYHVQSRSTAPIARMYSEDEMSGHLNGTNNNNSDRSLLSSSPSSSLINNYNNFDDSLMTSTSNNTTPPPPPPPFPPPDEASSTTTTATTTPVAAAAATPPAVRARTGSLVKFADGFDTNGDRYSNYYSSCNNNNNNSVGKDDDDDGGAGPHHPFVPTTPRNQEITVTRDAAAGTNMSALTPATNMTPDVSSSSPSSSPTRRTTNRRRPPRPQLLAARKQSDDASATTTTTPAAIKNDAAAAAPFGAASPASFADRWIRSSLPAEAAAGADFDDDNNNNDNQLFPSDALLATDKDGNTTRVSIENPYLLHEDPTPFVPTTTPSRHPPSSPSNNNNNNGGIISHATNRAVTAMMPFLAGGENRSSHYEMTTEDEIFHGQYGDLFDGEEDFAYSSSDEKESSRKASSAEQRDPLLHGGGGGVSSSDMNYSTEWTSLLRGVDDNRLERGDYHSTRRNGGGGGGDDDNDDDRNASSM